MNRFHKARRFFLLAAGALIPLLAGCAGSGGAGVTLSLAEDYAAFYPGEVRSLALTLDPVGGFSGPVNLELRTPSGDPAPSWVTLSPATVNVSGTTPVSLTLQVAAGTALGQYPLRVVAAGAFAEFTLHVVPELGSKWQTELPPVNEDFYGVTSGPGGAFLAVGANGKVYLSNDGGASWIDRSIGVSETMRAAAPVDATTYLVVGYNRSIWRLYVDTWMGDGLSPGGVGYFRDIVQGGGRYVVVGLGGDLYTSDDNGTTWTARTSGTTKTLEAVVHDGTRFVAVGDDGTIVASTDGATWTPLPSVGVPSLQGVAYGAGVFVAAASSGEVLVSSDGGNTWSTWDSGASWLYDVAFGDGVFVVVGADGTVLTSNDGGARWTRRSFSGDALRSVAYGDGRFVAVGMNGRVLTSP